jgi:hypothetical protein
MTAVDAAGGVEGLLDALKTVATETVSALAAITATAQAAWRRPGERFGWEFLNQ